MFKAVNHKTGEEIILIAAPLSGDEDDLRARCQRDILVCQECCQPVRVRMGTIRRWHFAHKHRHDCALTSESPGLLQARAVLYLWLVEKFGSAAVDVEQAIAGSVLPRPIDCVVSTDDQMIAFWIVDKELRPIQRDTIQTAIKDSGAILRWIFTSRLHQPVPEDEQYSECDEVLLTTTLRDLAHNSPYDTLSASWSPTGSLHFLDAEVEPPIITTYRSLRQVHPPQVFAGLRLRAPLAKVLIKRSSGELVHPGEHARLTALKKCAGPR